MASIAKTVSCLLAMTIFLALFHMENVSARRAHPKSQFILMPGRRNAFDLLQDKQRRVDLESATPDLIPDQDESTHIDLELLREIEKWLKAHSSAKPHMKTFRQEVGETEEY